MSFWRTILNKFSLWKSRRNQEYISARISELTEPDLEDLKHDEKTEVEAESLKLKNGSDQFFENESEKKNEINLSYPVQDSKDLRFLFSFFSSEQDWKKFMINLHLITFVLVDSGDEKSFDGDDQTSSNISSRSFRLLHFIVFRNRKFRIGYRQPDVSMVSRPADLNFLSNYFKDLEEVRKYIFGYREPGFVLISNSIYSEDDKSENLNLGFRTVLKLNLLVNRSLRSRLLKQPTHEKASIRSIYNETLCIADYFESFDDFKKFLRRSSPVNFVLTVEDSNLVFSYPEHFYDQKSNFLDPLNSLSSRTFQILLFNYHLFSLLLLDNNLSGGENHDLSLRNYWLEFFRGNIRDLRNFLSGNKTVNFIVVRLNNCEVERSNSNTSYEWSRKFSFLIIRALNHSMGDFLELNRRTGHYDIVASVEAEGINSLIFGLLQNLKYEGKLLQNSCKNIQAEEGISSFTEPVIPRPVLTSPSLMNLDRFADEVTDKILNGGLVGVDLLPLLEHPDLLEKVHERGKEDFINLIQNQVRKLPRIVWLKLHQYLILSLILIGLENYCSGSYWEYVINHPAYKSFMQKKTMEKVSLLRNILKQISEGSPLVLKKEGRNINEILMQGLVPQPYMGQYAELVYRIYVDRFNYLLPDNLDSRLMEIFKDKDSEIYQVQVTSGEKRIPLYTQIKTLRAVLETEAGLVEIIRLTKIILEYIDRKFMGRSTEDLAYYFVLAQPINDLFEQKNSVERPRLKSAGKIEKSRKPKAKFFFDNSDIFITIPEYHFSEEQMGTIGDFTLSILDEEQTISQESFSLFKDKDGYFTKETDIQVDFPLGHLRYEIRNEENIIISSEDDLYREKLIFNLSGNEISLTKIEPDEMYNLVVPNYSEVSNGDLIEDNENYQVRIVSYNELIVPYQVKKDHISSSDFKFFFSGYKHDGAEAYIGNRKTEFYRSINEVRMVSGNKSSGYLVKVNGRIKKAELIKNEISSLVKQWTVVLKDILKPGLNDIQIISTDSDRLSKKVSVLLDPDFIFHPFLNNDELSFELQSSLRNSGRTEIVEGGDYPVSFKYWDKHFNRMVLLVPKLKFPFIKVANGLWTKIQEKPVLIWDLNPYEKISLTGIEFDDIHATIKGKTIYHIPFSYQAGKYLIDAATIKNISAQESALLQLIFLKNSKAVGVQDFLFRPLLKKQSIYLDLDETNTFLKVGFECVGENFFEVEVKSEQDEEIFSDFGDQTEFHIPVSKLKFTETYSLAIYGGEEVFFSSKPSHVLLLEQQFSLRQFSIFADYIKWLNRRIKLNDLASNQAGRQILWPKGYSLAISDFKVDAGNNLELLAVLENKEGPIMNIELKKVIERTSIITFELSSNGYSLYFDENNNRFIKSEDHQSFPGSRLITKANGYLI